MLYEILIEQFGIQKEIVDSRKGTGVLVVVKVAVHFYFLCIT
jgi:hypothetical protein